MRSSYRVRKPFPTKNSRTSQGLSRTHFLRTQEGQNQAHIMLHQMLKVESAPIFVSDTWEALLDKIGNTKFQGLSSTDCNFQGLLRPWIFILKFKDFQGLSRRMRTLFLYRSGLIDHLSHAILYRIVYRIMARVSYHGSCIEIRTVSWKMYRCGLIISSYCTVLYNA